MGTGINLVDVIFGLPDDPVVPDSEKASFICPQGVVVSDIDITSKNGVYTLKCIIGGKKQPKKVLTDDECRWVDTGVVSALQMAVRVNRATVDKVAGASAVRTLFD